MGRTTRREFISGAAKLAAGASVAGCFPDVGGRWPVECEYPEGTGHVEPLFGNGKVVEVLDPASVESGEIQVERVPAMLEQMLASLTSNSPEPWHQILPDFAPGMRIGLKVNCLNDRVPTSVPLTKAVVDSLKGELGVPSEEIIVWDRRLDELSGSGFSTDTVGATVMGTVISTTDASGPGYEECQYTVAGKPTRLSRILTELTDVTINLPVLKTHEVSGVTGALKNIYGVIINPADFHDDLNTSLPQIYALPPIHDHIRLTVVDALFAVTAGGTASARDTVPCRLLVSQDPVAIDAYAFDLVNRLRQEKDVGLADIRPSAVAWLDNAQQAGLGIRQYALTAIEP